MSSAMETPSITRPLEVLIGAAKIAKKFGIKPEEVREMERSSAPIYRRGSSRVMVCEAAELWEWWKGRLEAHHPTSE